MSTPLAPPVERDRRACPECGGRWVNDLKFNHAPACQIGAADDGLRIADLERFKRLHSPVFFRPARPHELKLLHAIGWPIMEEATVIVADAMQTRDAAGEHIDTIWVRALNSYREPGRARARHARPQP
ncbi:hypothetical protein [Corynebacterium pseudopelargi]|uniref:Uncharacterized protein n=1 Tax=Corynebacterium pseudopelargi TaxID=2080757 RepID=A0A3G6ISL1_9CORY|nr:hypothetical protein [Corynebacterium pseudopelargi]AZA08635.1 hypothetical protein CPPEL_02495 [Corynebacterium pseudopelargi]